MPRPGLGAVEEPDDEPSTALAVQRDFQLDGVSHRGRPTGDQRARAAPGEQQRHGGGSVRQGVERETGFPPGDQDLGARERGFVGKGEEGGIGDAGQGAQRGEIGRAHV